MASRGNLLLVALLAVAVLCRCDDAAPTRDMLGCGDDAACYDSPAALATTKDLCRDHALRAAPDDATMASDAYKECLAALLPERFRPAPRKPGKGFGGPADACTPRYNFDVECGRKHPTREMLHCRDDACYAASDTASKAEYLCSAYVSRNGKTTSPGFLERSPHDLCMLHVLPEKRTPVWNSAVGLLRLLARLAGW
jgi:hypothetical protein